MRSVTPALFLAIAALTSAIAATEASAQTSHVPPGDPCVKNNGNPCNGSNGNLGQQGNASGERRIIDRKPPPINMAMPLVRDRGAFVDQIGTASVATIVQTAPNAYARVVQTSGPGNEAEVTQRGTGTAYAAVAQSGSGQLARADQAGSGSNALWVTQSGSGNLLLSRQYADGATFNGAALSQVGINNDMSLVQAGSDNRAVLSQEGEGNSMTVAQTGVGNRLTWNQQGNYLSDLQIAQNGGSVSGGQLLITQTNK